MNNIDPAWGKTELNTRHEWVSAPESPKKESLLRDRNKERERLIKCFLKACVPALIFIIAVEVFLAVIEIEILKARPEIHCLIGLLGGIIIARVQRHLAYGSSFPKVVHNSLSVNLMQSLFVLILGLAILYVLNTKFFVLWILLGIVAGYVAARNIYWWYAHLFLHDQPPGWRRFP